jgi:hypothetical protein
MDGTITSGSSNSSVINSFNSTTMVITGNVLSERNGVCGSPTTGCVVGSGIAADGTISGNTCSYMDDCIDTYNAGTVISGNVVHDMINSTDPGNHGNSFHVMCYAYVHDNIVYNLAGSGQGVSGDLNEPRCGTASGNYYTWNNVFWNLGNQGCFTDRPNDAATGGTVNYYHYNDTCVYQSGIRVQTDSGKCPTSVSIYNEFGFYNSYSGSNATVTTGTITSATAPFTAVDSGCTIPTQVTITTSVPIGVSQATAQGYTAANYFQPTSGSKATVGVGTNEGNLCSGALAPLCYALNAVAPATNGAGRPPAGGGNWDVGAYQFSSSVRSSLVPPTSLSATVE